MLRDTYGIPIEFEDFLCNVGGKEKHSQTIMALEFAHLKAGERLMVVSCSYRMGTNTSSLERFVIAEDSAKFSLIEALG